MKTDKFVVEKSCHGMQCIQAGNLSFEQCRSVRAIMRDNYSSSDSYRRRAAVGAFLQGYDESRSEKEEGWILIEFWQDQNPQAIEDFVAHVNANVPGIGEETEHTDTYWFRADSHLAEAQFKPGYTLGEVMDRANAFAREWGLPPSSVTYGLVSTAVEGE